MASFTLLKEAHMSTQNLDVVRSTYAAFGRGDIQALLDTLDPNVEWITPGPDDLPSAGTRRGREAVGEFFTTIGGLFEFLAFEPQTFIADGEHVVVLGRDRVKVKATGEVIEEAWAHHMTLRNGKTVAFREYIDTSATVAAFRTAKAAV
jgi:ketosteroid isomerase-like protein